MIGRSLFASSSRRAILSLALLVSKPSSSLAFAPTGIRSFSSTTSLAMTKKVLVPIGDDSEEIETSCITDTLTRFGAEVTVASVKNGELLVKMSRGLKIMADISIEAAAMEEWDLIALPGGMPGATNLKESAALKSLLVKQKDAKKLYGAVCAAPAIVLSSHGLLDDTKPNTCNPNFREHLKLASDEKVVVNDNVVTSQGPGTSLLFALALGEKLYGKEKRDEIAKQMLVE